MFWKYIFFILLQTASLAGGQFMFKLLLNRMGKFELTWAYIKDTTIHHGWIALVMVFCYVMSFVLWTVLLKKMEFSQAYPLSSLSFVFGLLLAHFLLPECVPATRWIGTILIVAGCVLVSMK